MPYITPDKRYNIDTGYESPITAGELNYRITKTILLYMADKGKSYQTINDIIGALEGAKLEFYRRIAAPYEDGAKDRNGDVY